MKAFILLFKTHGFPNRYTWLEQYSALPLMPAWLLLLLKFINQLQYFINTMIITSPATAKVMANRSWCSNDNNFNKDGSRCCPSSHWWIFLIGPHHRCYLKADFMFISWGFTSTARLTSETHLSIIADKHLVATKNLLSPYKPFTASQQLHLLK